MNSASRESAEAVALPLVANPVLSRVRDFIDADESPPPLDPIGIARRALRGRTRRVVVAAGWVALLAALSVALLVRPAYQSSGMIRVLPREARTLYAESDDSRLRLYDAYVAAEMELLLSRPVLEVALARLHENREALAVVPADVGDLAAMIGVTGKKGLISVAARSADPGLSAATVNALLDAYEASNEAARRRNYEVRREELIARETELGGALARLDGQYLQIGGEHDRGSLSKAHVARTAQLEVLDERIAELDNTITQMQATGGAGADVGSVEIQRATLLDQATADMTYERARRLAALQTLRGRYLSSHPRLQAAEGELAVLESAIAERREQIAMLGKAGALTGSGSGAAQQSLADLQTLRSKLVARREDTRREAEEFNSRLIRIGAVVAEQSRIAELLKETKRALDEVDVESANDLSRSIEIVARGKVPDGPIEDKRKPLALGAAVFGGLGTFLCVVLGTLLAGRVRFSDDLDESAAESLAAVAPEDSGPQRALAQPALQLRNELDLRWPEAGERPLVIGVTTAVSGSGGTSVAEALARTYAQAGRRVLLVDAHPGSAGLTRMHAAGRADEGTDAVALGRSALERALFALPCTGGTLDLLPASIVPSAAGLAVEDVRRLIDAARGRHDVTVLDLGPLIAGRQSAVGAALSDRVVLAAACGVRRGELGAALGLLERLAPDRALLLLNRAVTGDPALDVPRDPPAGGFRGNDLIHSLASLITRRYRHE